MGQRTALQQIDDMAVDSGAQNVRAHHQNSRGAGLRSRRDALGYIGKLRMRVLGRCIAERQPAAYFQIARARRKRLNDQLAAVEALILALHAENKVWSSSSRQV